MKRLFILALALGIGASPVMAETVFEENFTTPVYEIADTVPLDFGVIRHGRWRGIPRQSRPAYVAERDGKRVLELRPTPGFPRGSRLIGAFGKDAHADTPVTTGLRLEITFLVTGPIREPFYIQVLGGDGKSKATVDAGPDGELRVSFGGERQTLGFGIDEQKWYRLEFILPAQPRTKSHYTANLYEGETLLQSKEGVMARSVEEGGNNYTAFDIQHGHPGTILQIRSIKAETLP